MELLGIMFVMFLFVLLSIVLGLLGALFGGLIAIASDKYRRRFIEYGMIAGLALPTCTIVAIAIIIIAGALK